MGLKAHPYIGFVVVQRAPSPLESPKVFALSFWRMMGWHGLSEALSVPSYHTHGHACGESVPPSRSTGSRP